MKKKNVGKGRGRGRRLMTFRMRQQSQSAAPWPWAVKVSERRRVQAFSGPGRLWMALLRNDSIPQSEDDGEECHHASTQPPLFQGKSMTDKNGHLMHTCCIPMYISPSTIAIYLLPASHPAHPYAYMDLDSYCFRGENEISEKAITQFI